MKDKNSDKFGKQKRDSEKLFLYKGMENLNNLEHKFHQDRDDKFISNSKFNFRYYKMKTQL